MDFPNLSPYAVIGLGMTKTGSGDTTIGLINILTMSLSESAGLVPVSVTVSLNRMSVCVVTSGAVNDAVCLVELVIVIACPRESWTCHKYEIASPSSSLLPVPLRVDTVFSSIIFGVPVSASATGR